MLYIMVQTGTELFSEESVQDGDTVTGFTLEFKDCGRSIKYSITYLSLYFVSCTSADCSLSLLENTLA